MKGDNGEKSKSEVWRQKYADRESKSDKLYIYLKWGLHNEKSANHIILSMGGGGGLG
jgi:hypothetical protein